MTRLRRFFAGNAANSTEADERRRNGHCGTLQISDLVAAVGIGADIAAEIPFSPARSQHRLQIDHGRRASLHGDILATLIRRIFTTGYPPRLYTEEGLEWVADNSLVPVLLRHFTLAAERGWLLV
jgi:hypothetical protein